MTAQKKARVAVIREMQDAAPDLPFEQVGKEVADTVKKARGKRIQRVAIDTNILTSRVISKKKALRLF
ncbi:MAG: hypothetical protein IMZ73_00170 [Chloroflexi bacterium]|nr:hypothetical protein [Chloroflexota bacterium]